MKIETILCRAGTMDNYAYLIIDEKTGDCVVVDAPETKAIVDACKRLDVVPKYILNTHHHYDHTDSNLELKKIFGAKIVGAVYDEHRIPGIDITVKDFDIFEIGSLKAKIIKAIGHTTGHILWYFEDEKALFTGDVLFNLCVGGLFEGTPAQMFETLAKIKNLPDDVMFYPGHEYTAHGFGFAQSICGNDPVFVEYVQIAQERISKAKPVCPISLGMEKRCNPYLLAKNVVELADIC